MLSQEQLQGDRNTNRDPRETSLGGDRMRSPELGNREGERLRPTQPRVSPTSRFLLVLILLAALIGGAIYTMGQYVATRSSVPSHTFTLNGHGKLIVTDSSGQIHIHSGSGNTVTVQATRFAYGLGDPTDPMQLDFSQDGNTLHVMGKGWSFMGNQGYDLDITAPDSIDLQVENGAGEIEVANINGEMDLHTGSGGITASHLAGKMKLQTGNGGINIHDLSGQIDLQSGNGDIQASQMKLQDEGEIKTGNGGIRLDGILDPNAHYRLETGSGGVEVTLPSNASFQLHTDTGSGSVHNDFGTSNASTNSSLDIHSGSGDINIHKG
ncbi:MAG TPA: DUF4097 family beta strand repeat-containing protein [Ktedonosporobacter sp.]|nr:DUF4097 family beta strand repeat-containing protein [Ktedonosporobacter sp.]